MLISCQDDKPEVISQSYLIDILETGAIVRVDQEKSEDNEIEKNVASVNGEIIGVLKDLTLSQSTFALTQCPPPPFNPTTYWWICQMQETKGHALGRGPAYWSGGEDPTVADIGVYEESPTEEYPADMTSSLLFSQKPEHWPNWVGAPNENALFGLMIAKFEGHNKWENPHHDWCDKDVGIHPDRCYQVE